MAKALTVEQQGLRAEERFLFNLLQHLEDPPNGRDWEDPKGHSEAYKAWERVALLLNTRLEVVRDTIWDSLRNWQRRD